MANTIITKNSATASAVPTSGDLVQGELAVNVTDKRLFTEDSGGTVVEVGTNPSSLTLTSGTANGVAYLNGSKVLTSGSALTFDGTSMSLSSTSSTLGLGTTTATSTATPNTLYLGGTYSSTPGANAKIRVYWDGTNTYGFGVSGTTGLEYITSNTAPHVFFIGGSEQMRLTSTGLGIGTSSPSYKLDVNGNARVQGVGNSLLFDTTGASATSVIGTTNDYWLTLLSGRGTGSKISLTNDTGIRFYGVQATEQMRLDSAGNLGLGVTPSGWDSAFKAFQLNTTGAIASTSNRTFVGQNWYDSASGGKHIANGFALRYDQIGANGSHAWYTSTSGTAGAAISFTQAMTLDASGNLGIGTSSPGTKLDVRGTANAVYASGGSGANNYGVYGVHGRGGYLISGYYNGTNDFSFYGNSNGYLAGNLGIGTSTINGKIHAASASAANLILENTTAAKKWQINSSSGGVLNFGVYGVDDYMFLTSTGLGIGTSSPSYRLEIATDSGGNGIKVTRGADSFFQQFQSTAGGVSLAASGSSGYLAFRTGTTAGTTTERARIDSNGTLRLVSGTQGNQIQFWDTSGAAERARIGVNAANGLDFAAGSTTPRMTITSSGNVGIGTSVPTQRLSVSGVIGAYGSGGGQAANPSANHTSSSSVRVGLRGNLTTSDNASLYGVGTYLTNNVFFKNATGYPGYIESAPASYIALIDDVIQFRRIGSGTANADITSFPESMRIDSSGNLLVGTTSSAVPNLSSIMLLGGGVNEAYAGVVRITHGSNGVSGSGFVDFWHSQNNIGSISQSGTTSVAYNTTSDYRLKEDWQPMTGASERVKALKPVNFAWKADGSRVDGFLAHEAQAVVPEAVTGEKDAVDAEGKPVYQGIDQSKLVPLLTAALKEALAEIESLKARLDAANL